MHANEHFKNYEEMLPRCRMYGIVWRRSRERVLKNNGMVWCARDNKTYMVYQMDTNNKNYIYP